MEPIKEYWPNTFNPGGFMFRFYIMLILVLFIITGCSNDNNELLAPNDLVELEMGNSAQVLSLLEKYSEPDDSVIISSISEGTLVGQWIKNEIFANDGLFDGVWYDEDSEPVSYYNGIFWTTEDNHQLFSGSLSGYYTDDVQGYIFGIWYYDDPRMCPMCGAGHGQFKGFFVRYNDQGVGIIKGEFGDYTLPFDELVMPMTGIWKMYNSELIIDGYNVEDGYSD
jgi:hypothetical protein